MAGWAAHAAARPTATLTSPPLLPHLQAYLRLARIPFAVQECAAASASPTGQLPALDAGEDLIAGESGQSPSDEWAAAKTLLEYLRLKVGGGW